MLNVSKAAQKELSEKSGIPWETINYMIEERMEHRAEIADKKARKKWNVEFAEFLIDRINEKMKSIGEKPIWSNISVFGYSGKADVWNCGGYYDEFEDVYAAIKHLKEFANICKCH